ncbi:hypothetical protein [Lactiplantibacillus plantarum]|uniref:hypothetical protein n=1 Tax=Lactiplantibacillus plantarum TaxID=1590 RepID=UPI00280B4742|nr:hypothetical protein [Lactiplantibacillus plantarum]
MINGDYINYWLGSPKAHKYGKNVTITKQDILWGNPDIYARKADKATIGNDFYSAKYIYNNPNGSSYLSLYDKNIYGLDILIRVAQGT